MLDIDNYKEFSPVDHTNPQKKKCFGCSQENSVGLRMRFFTNGETVVSLLTVPPHLCGWNNLVHGGVVTSILDEIMGTAGIHLMESFILTKSMSVNFIKPLLTGRELTAQAYIMEKTGPREIRISGKLFNDNGDLAATSEGVFAVVSPGGLQKIKIDDKGKLRSFEDVINSCDTGLV